MFTVVTIKPNPCLLFVNLFRIERFTNIVNCRTVVFLLKLGTAQNECFTTGRIEIAKK